MKTMPLTNLAAALAALTVGACAAGGDRTPAAPLPARAAGAEAREVGTLAPRQLAAGECGMFLWSKAADRSLVFFNTRGGSGQMVLDGREVELVRAAADGAEVLGQFERQTFSHGSTSVELQIQFERRPGLTRGAVIPQGALRLKRDDGWEYILPVGGLVGCEQA